MKPIRFILLALAFAAVALPMRAASSTGVLGILISASNESGATDSRLAEYEPNLKRILRFESYRFLGEDSTSLDVPGAGRLSIGSGHQLELETEAVDGRGIHVKVRWQQGGRTLMSTSLVLRAGVPAVLGGPSTGKKGEVFAVILVGR